MDILYRTYAFIFGALIGSFLNVVILRLPEKKDMVMARSACPKCGHQLRWYHNIPILSFLALKGRCKACHQKISWQYPIVELLTALFALALFPPVLTTQSLFHYGMLFTILCLFLCMVVIDVRHYLLPDALNLALGLVMTLYALQYLEWQFSLSGMALGLLFPLSVTWLFYKLRGKIGLGGGDIKLYGVLGIYLGPIGILNNIFWSCTLGSVVGLLLVLAGKMERNRPLPFGPAIIVVASLQIFFPSWLISLV